VKNIQSIGVYCSSYTHLKGIYTEAAIALGEALAQHQITMIYGGGAQGLMGTTADTVMTNGGRVVGFLPQHLKELENPNLTITEMHMVDSMHTRKRLMFERSDAFFILPGGFGTLDETFELITWRQLKLHEKPIIFININHYWDSFEALTKNIFEQGFAKPEDRAAFKFVRSVPEAFQALSTSPQPSSQEPMAKWV
jgi:uncharacterized protein (TIGR00730 family)